MRRLPLGSAVFGLALAFTAQAVPVTYSHNPAVALGAWNDSVLVNRYGDFSDAFSRDFGFTFAGFDSSLGTLQSVQLTMESTILHPTITVLLPEVSGLVTPLPYGGIAQDTERTLHGVADLWAYYDAQLSWRADFRFTVDPQFDGLFPVMFADAGFGSCSTSADLFLDIGDRNPHCIAQNAGLTLSSYIFDWGTLTGAALDAFRDPFVSFNMNLTGDVYGHCDDDDVGDYCRLNLTTNWITTFHITYTYDDGTSVPVPEPATMSLLGAGLLAAFTLRRRRVNALLSG